MINLHGQRLLVIVINYMNLICENTKICSSLAPRAHYSFLLCIAFGDMVSSSAPPPYPPPPPKKKRGKKASYAGHAYYALSKSRT